MFERQTSFEVREKIPTGIDIINQALKARLTSVDTITEADTIPTPTSPEELHQAIYSEYLKVKTEKHTAKWLHRIRSLFRKNNPDEIPTVVYKEAVRANQAFDLAQGLESKAWEQNLDLVRTEMIRYKNGDRDVRPVLLVLGGAMKGIHAAAQLQALEELGYKDAFAAIGGISAGSGPAAFFASGQTHKAISLFIEECTTNKFLNLSSKNLLPQNWKHILNLNVIKEFMETPGEKGLAVDELSNTPTDVFTIATNETGVAEIIDIKTATHNNQPNMVAACVASASIPLFCPEGHEVNGKKYVDGSVGDVPLHDIANRYQATSILILANHSFYDQDRFEETTIGSIVQSIGKTLGTGASLGSATSVGTTLTMQNNKSIINKLANFITQRKQDRETLEAFGVNNNVKIAVHFPPPSDVGNLTNDPHTFAAAMCDTYLDTRTRFSQVG